LEKVATDHVASLKTKDVEFSEMIVKTEEEYCNALTKHRQDHSEVIEKQVRGSSIALERLKGEHASQLRVAELAKEGGPHSQNPKPPRRRLSESRRESPPINRTFFWVSNFTDHHCMYNTVEANYILRFLR
jgi:hypothetical protein